MQKVCAKKQFNDKKGHMTYDIRTVLNYALWRIGIVDTLPVGIVRAVSVEENNDRLVNLRDDNTLKFDNRLICCEEVLFRNDAYRRLKLAQRHLPNGYTFIIFDAFRPLSVQKASWNKRLLETRRDNPTLSEDEVRRLTRLKVADPGNGGYGGHQTGGAIDLGICEEKGKLLDMGSSYEEYCSKTKTRNSIITSLQASNRKILVDAMIKSGFVNFPAEWWHYSYGDKLWAAYSKKKKCIYGMAKEEGEK
jgi:zinc D-Ala-D-Ala dipeptidase